MNTMEFFHVVFKYSYLVAAILSTVACIGALYLLSEKEKGKGFWTRKVELSPSVMFLLLPVVIFWIAFARM